MAELGPSVLADLLVLASEAGVDRLVETDRLLRNLVGSEPTNQAHRIWTNRIQAGVKARPVGLPSGRAMEEDSDVFDLLRAIREATPAPLRAPR